MLRLAASLAYDIRLVSARPSPASVAVRVLQEAEDNLPQPGPGIRVGDRAWGVIQPLSQDEIDQTAAAAATPEARLAVVLDARRPRQGDPRDPP